MSMKLKILSKRESTHLANIGSSNCEPLYLTPLASPEVHDAEKPNATLTYVKYKGDLFGVTCAHVWDLQFDDAEVKNQILGVFRGSPKSTSSGPRPSKFEMEIKSLRGQVKDKHYADIAIARLPKRFATEHMKVKGKAPILLDSWLAPDWSKLKTCVAFGFPTALKTQSSSTVSAQPLFSIAALTSSFNPNCEKFSLYSEVENEYSLSGMSGGPVYWIKKDDTLGLLGIIFEGSPANLSATSGDNSIFPLQF